MKIYMALLASALLVGCGGGGGGSSSGSNPEPQAQETKDDGYCASKDKVISLNEGESCTLSEEQFTALTIGIRSDTEISRTVTCENNRFQLGVLSTGGYTSGGWTLKCLKSAEQLAEEERENRIADLKERYKFLSDENSINETAPFDNYADLDQVSFTGNAETLEVDGKSYSQVDADGEFNPFFTIVSDDFFFFDNDTEGGIAVIFTDPSVKTSDFTEGKISARSDLYFNSTVINNANVNVAGKQTVTIECSYPGTLDKLLCGGRELDLSQRFTQLPALVKAHILACDTSGRNAVCRNGAGLNIQFN